MGAAKKKILVVEDDIHIRTLLVEAFHMEDCEAICAGSGDEAKEVLSKESVDVVLSDIRMPDGTGLDLLDYIKSTRNIPVFMMTAYADTTSEIVKQKGAEQLIAKPFDVFHVIHQILGKK